MAHVRDVARVNEVLALHGNDLQLAQTADGRLLPPKFFGGDPRRLAERFVLSMSLNHSVPEGTAFEGELSDFQQRDTCWEAHLQYFQKAYAHWRFFQPRAKVLAAYAAAIGEHDVPTDWQPRNERYALYVETVPTFSRGFTAHVEECDWSDLRDLFVVSLNSLARRIAIELLRPSRALLAGQASWDCLPSKRRLPHPMALGVSTDIVTLPGGTEARVVRSNFLGRSGPNSDEELARLGRVLAGIEGEPLHACGITRDRLVEIARGHGFAIKERSWTHVVPPAKRLYSGRRRIFAFRGDPVREVHLRSYPASPDPLFIPCQGLFRLRPMDHGATDVERAVKAAFAVLGAREVDLQV